MKLRRILSLAIALVMLSGLLAACSGDPSPSGSAPSGGGDNPGQTDSGEIKPYDRTRDIYLGQWWDSHYDSSVSDLAEDEGNPLAGGMRLDNIRRLEEKYNIRFYYVNMTFDGARESLNTSLKAGTPDVDIYTLDTQFMIPPIRTGYAIPISTYVKDPNHDMYNAQKVFTPLNICDMPEDYAYGATPMMNPNNTYMLGFNWDILQEYGQPNPQDLYDSGDWTWDAWMNIMKACTDMSKSTPIYGWSGGHVRYLENLLMSNNAGIALGPTETLTSPATKEVYEFINDMYNVSNVAKPWDQSVFWENGDWSNGDLAFFIWITWLAQGYGVGKTEDCPYDIRVVPWPIGPNAAREGGVKNTVNLNGNVFMIPVGTPDPEVVFAVHYEFVNWWGDDLSFRDDFTWMEDLFGDDMRGYEFSLYCGSKPQYDLWVDLNMQDENGEGFANSNVMDGNATPAQFAEKWKNIVQDYINRAYGIG